MTCLQFGWGGRIPSQQMSPQETAKNCQFCVTVGATVASSGYTRKGQSMAVGLHR